MLSRKPRAIRYALGALFLATLFGGQLTGLVASLAAANSSGAEPLALVPSAAVPSPEPQSSSCIFGVLDASDQTYNRPSAIIAPSCIPSNTFPRFDAYTFNVSGCTSPSVTVSTCTGPCGTQSALDTILFVYQKAGGAPATPPSPIFAPANPCTNIQAANNNFCTPASQITMPVQTTSSSGDFVVIVTSSLATQTGTYNLRVDAPGCIVTQVAQCIYSLSSSGASFLAAGASSSVTVTVDPTCPWTAVSNDAFITVDSGSPGLGNGTVNYTVAANTGAARIGTMTIAAQTFTVTQEAGTVSLPCIDDALVSGNGTFIRPSTATIPPTCPPNPNPPINFYKAYELTLSGCTSGAVTASTCGTSPCSSTGTLADTVLFFYRKSDGSPSSPGSPIFDPANPCTNIVSGNNNFCGALAQLTTVLNAGSFVAVVTSNGGGQTGTFNLGVTASGCTVTFVPPCSSVTGTVSGGGTICAGGSSTVTVTLSGGTPPYTVTLDNGGGTQIGSSPLNFIVSPSATTTYSVASGSDSASCPVTGSGSATVIVNQPPTTATVGGPQTICSGGTSAGLGGNTPTVGTGSWSVVSGGAGTFNPNAGTPNATFTHTSGAGPIVVRWTISNPPCPSSSADVTITIDNIPPMIVCPGNVTATAPPGQQSAVVTYPPPTVTDNCPGATASCTPPSGSTFPVGTTTVTCTATDSNGNQAFCQFTVTVNGSVLATKDSFLRDGSENTNEGANNQLRIQATGNNRVVVAFDLSGISTVGLQSATLVLNIEENSDNWGPTGRLVDAHRLLANWTEGNGHTVGSQPNFRGTGEGVTWACAKDTDISNHATDCASQWNGGTFAAATAAGVLHSNGQTGPVSWNVTADVLAGANNGWLIKKQNESQTGQVRYYSREGAVVAGNPSLGPRLVLVYAP